MQDRRGGVMRKPMDSKRSPHWRIVRKAFLMGKSCAVCGGTKRLEAHHKVPFHLDMSLEPNPFNLIALCEGKKSINCHLIVGHLGNFRGFNPDVEMDAATLVKKM